MGRRPIILLVEDEALIALQEKKELTENGYIVLVAGSGEEAIRAAGDPARPIDLILMDIDLGEGIDGTQAAERILRAKDIPIVFLSSHTEPEVVEKTEKISSYGYVVKNTGIVVLDASIKMALKLFGSKLERQRAEETLRENRNMLDQILNTIPQGVFWKDRESRFLGCNLAFARAFGFDSPDRIIGKTDFDLPAPREEADAYRADDRLVMESAQPLYHIVEPLIEKDGGRLWIDTSKMPLIDGRGDVYGVLGIYDDITERLRMEESLRDSEERYRTLFETMAQGVVYQDSSGAITSANPAAQRILGLSMDQMQGRSSIDPSWRAIREDGSPFPGEDHPAMEALRSGKEVRNVVMGVFNPLTRENAWININAVPQFRSNDPRPFQVYTTFDDITESKRVEEDLKKSKTRYQQLVENAADGIFTVDSDGRFLFANARFRSMLGYTNEELLRLTILDTYIHEHRDSGRNRITALNRGDHLRFERLMARKDGSAIRVEVNAWRSDDGTLEAIVRDVTGRKAIGQEPAEN